MKKLFLVSMLCLTFTIPAKADFWKKLKNAVIGTDATSSSNSSGKTGGTRGYLITDDWGNKKIVNPFDKNDYRDEDNIYGAERDALSIYRNLQGVSTKVDYVECKLRPGNFLREIGNKSFYGYVKFPVYVIGPNVSYTSGVIGCFEKDKSGKEKENNGYLLYLDHNLAMYIWDNQLTVKTIAMKNGKMAETGYPDYDSRHPYFDSQNPGTEIFINGQKVNIK